ncbi:hypothetical protein BRADI_4g40047v3 [Brachypodium distachyon]|uniref:Zinc finger PHD-type domain-containing protein n=1 Tax=Brachypodium distachyon TaxID=15368 RepID=A0A2K2CTE1_BRADI|nr:hypothetical protein BRADI_4g40047v3 [Brachypodium distachyon]
MFFQCLVGQLLDIFWILFQKYICKNCKSKQHQCFACGLLGSSDLTSGTEVFQCKDKQCARFYHPKCVAEVLYPDSKSRALRFGNDVASGLEFHCPMHRCSLCKEAGNRDDKDMRLAVCGRCPTAYHRTCLPREISFRENKEKGIQKRAWDDVLPDQDFIYCMKHKMEKDLRTPRRDHIVFPDTRNPCAAKRPRGQETLKEDMIDRPLPSRSPQETEAGCDKVKPIDSFAPRHLFPRPHPGSCGCLDD